MYFVLKWWRKRKGCYLLVLCLHKYIIDVSGFYFQNKAKLDIIITIVYFMSITCWGTRNTRVLLKSFDQTDWTSGSEEDHFGANWHIYHVCTH